MGIFSKFEGKMEDTVEGAASKMSKAPISPVQIAKKAEKQMKRETMVGAGKQYAPTLYTVLVNPDDDTRLFGYYPTLAGETETYLEAKAAQEGLVMDGHPLVRFIVDDSLKHGKFDIIAEMVAAPIVDQLRAEEMERYGIRPRRPQGNQPGYQLGYQPNPASSAVIEPFGNDAWGGYGYGGQQGGWDNGPAEPGRADAGYPAGPDQADAGYPAGPDRGQAGYPSGSDRAQGGYPSGSNHAQAGGPSEPGRASAGYAPAAEHRPMPSLPELESEPAPEPQRKPPLPYVPEADIDRSIDYGEYTFNSEDFEDYRGKVDEDDLALAYNEVYHPSGAVMPAPRQNAAQPAPQAQSQPQPQQALQPEPAPAPAVQQANTVAFAAGGAAANAVPDRHAVRARLVDLTYRRPYDLAGAHITLGRESGNDIVVQDINASRKHAELRLNAQGIWVISDRGSTNGTVVNGVSVASQPLYPGDIITIGKTEFQFTLV